MWKETEYEISELANIAVDCIDEESEEWKISGTRETQLFPHLIHILMEKINLESLSEYYLKI